MELKGSNIRNTVSKLTSSQVSKIGKQIGATGDISHQRRAIDQHIKDHHGTALKAEKFLKSVGMNRDKQEFTSVLSGLKGIDANSANAKKDFKTSVGSHTQEEWVNKAVKDSLFRKMKRSEYGDSFDQLVKKKIEHIEHVKEVSIRGRMHDDAKVMLQQRIDEQARAEFGNTNSKKGGTSAPGAGQNKQAPPVNSGQFMAL